MSGSGGEEEKGKTDEQEACRFFETRRCDMGERPKDPRFCIACVLDRVQLELWAGRKLSEIKTMYEMATKTTDEKMREKIGAKIDRLVEEWLQV